MSSDDAVMEEHEAEWPDRRTELLELYDVALPEVYGYLVRRCPTVALAEDLTGETFVAALDACARERRSPDGAVAGHRRPEQARRPLAPCRATRTLHVVAHEEPPDTTPDRDDGTLDEARVVATLAGLGPHHQAALTLRYLDGLPVPEVAHTLGRTLHATEALLMRAKRAFRQAYEGGQDG